MGNTEPTDDRYEVIMARGVLHVAKKIYMDDEKFNKKQWREFYEYLQKEALLLKNGDPDG